mmetsp:Transcript_87761/g.253428  ORF Transcript_87761/g.253428 Transcript_87761/m.253428 type:complete len:258 (-) Transcript_87761:103-876(-)
MPIASPLYRLCQTFRDASVLRGVIPGLDRPVVAQGATICGAPSCLHNLLRGLLFHSACSCRLARFLRASSRGPRFRRRSRCRHGPSSCACRLRASSRGPCFRRRSRCRCGLSSCACRLRASWRDWSDCRRRSHCCRRLLFCACRLACASRAASPASAAHSRRRTADRGRKSRPQRSPSLLAPTTPRRPRRPAPPPASAAHGLPSTASAPPTRGHILPRLRRHPRRSTQHPRRPARRRIAPPHRRRRRGRGGRGFCGG